MSPEQFRKNNAKSSHLSNSLKELERLFKREMPDSKSTLAPAAAYHFKNPGKSFRAQLALTSGMSLGLNQQDNLHWAAACELLHNASLIHDDISDASTHRRGQESINEHFGADMALCLGDWMVAKAFELGARNSLHGGKLAALLAQAMQETCSGQISDITQRECADLDNWKRIAKGKTAPLLIAPIKGAAIAAGDMAARVRAVTRSVQMKADIVERDETEQGDRALLNLGHTFCHALEAATGFGDRLLHGEGVSIGCALAFELSARLGLCSQEDPSRVRTHLKAMGMKTDLADIDGDLPDAAALLALMGQDKKVVDGKLRFILARGIGDAFITSDVPADVVLSVLRDGLALR